MALQHTNTFQKLGTCRTKSWDQNIYYFSSKGEWILVQNTLEIQLLHLVCDVSIHLWHIPSNVPLYLKEDLWERVEHTLSSPRGNKRAARWTLRGDKMKTADVTTNRGDDGVVCVRCNVYTPKLCLLFLSSRAEWIQAGLQRRRSVIPDVNNKTNDEVSQYNAAFRVSYAATCNH